jgi:hypothetical protein
MAAWTFSSRPTIWRRRLTALASLFLLATAALAAGFPKPAAVPRSWELDFQPGELRLYFDSTGAAYWYFTYVVTNNTGGDRIWAPQFTLLTDTGDILDSGDGVSPYVTEQIIRLLDNELLEQQNEIIGDLLQGEEHARDGLVVWPATNLNVNEISMFIAGLSGETARVVNPATGESKVLRKTLQRDYLIPGSAAARGSEPVDLIEESWILR